MLLYKESCERLHDFAMEPSQPGSAFHVHYWGVAEKLSSNPVHKHSFFEICYVLGGTGEYTDGGVDYSLRKGVLFCSRPGITHQIRTRDGLSIVFVAFEPDDAATDESMLEAWRQLADKGRVYAEASRSATELLWESLLLRENDRSCLPEAAVPAAACALLISFLSLFGENERRSAARPRQDSAIVRRAKLYIRDNLGERLSLGEVAGYLNVSERHLSRLFGLGIHENFSDYVRSERVRQAAKLLVETDMPIKAIAEATGFSSVHYFTRTFAQAKLIPPGKYRSKLRG
ncbi:helix-turn-helix domain-containing protein [Paenibacillus contaminans]|uniref:AraC family transcriptional regulator n=1 Tax=Paenibacillus contaminans TaxID=450362 RepID=A0A329LND8_9BACL|nr:helix-turn-helix domain-containing protein [Paenibacillus contaminans]RAV08730.1 AraC family transcriptional regulator [Paenibacillus contaminans]